MMGGAPITVKYLGYVRSLGLCVQQLPSMPKKLNSVMQMTGGVFGSGQNTLKKLSMSLWSVWWGMGISTPSAKFPLNQTQMNGFWFSHGNTVIGRYITTILGLPSKPTAAQAVGGGFDCWNHLTPVLKPLIPGTPMIGVQSLHGSGNTSADSPEKFTTADPSQKPVFCGLTERGG